MLHRAIIGSFERFIGILIEEYSGSFPLWLAPVQVAVATITSDLNDYAMDINKLLVEAGIRSAIDISPEKINYKIRSFSKQKVPIIAVIGKQEMLNNTVTIRQLGSDEQKNLSASELVKLVKDENLKYLHNAI